jgi:LysM repeat protein
MSYENGKIPAADLTTVAVGVQLVHGAANAYRALVAAGAHEHISVKPAPGVGSGYRDIESQELVWAAWNGDKAAAAKVHLNTSSMVKPAAPGGSSHGWGDRIDLLFDGSQDPTAADLNLAKRYGFTREFGSADSNHFEHDGKTAIHPPQAATPAVFYLVQPGDNLTRIAAAHGLTLTTLEQMNRQIPDYNMIHPGDKIRVR